MASSSPQGPSPEILPESLLAARASGQTMPVEDQQPVSESKGVERVGSGSPGWSVPSTIVCFGASFTVLAGAALTATLGAPPALVVSLWLGGMILFAFTCLMALARAVRGIADVTWRRRDISVGLGTAIADLLGNLLMATFGAFVAYLSTVGFSRGRQLRRLGRVLLPDLRPSAAWTTVPLARTDVQGAPTGVADQWRENGKTEHASVAAFARLTLDLMALGAPPSLVAAANRDALDEIRHAELCFSLAAGFDGRSVSPAPFPQAQRVATLPRHRRLALSKLAVDSLVDGALHEGVSARIIAKLAQRAEGDAMRTILKEIAADEGRHAAHGWVVVEWCLAEGGNAVAQALLGAIAVLPDRMPSTLPDPAAGGGWERWGIHGRALEEKEYAAARTSVCGRVSLLVSRASDRAA